MIKKSPKSGYPGKRLLFAANSFDAVGGVETSVLPWIEEAEAQGYSIEFVLCRIRGQRADLLENRGIYVHYHRLYWHFRGFQIPNPFGIWSLSRRIRSESFHSVISLQPPSHYFVRIAILLSRCRPRTISMEQLSYSDRALPYVWMDRWLSRITSKTVCVSGSLSREFLERTGLPSESSVGIPHGIKRPDKSAPDLNLARRIQGRFVIGCIARITIEKRQRFLIDCFERFMTDCDLRPVLLLVGDEGEDPTLRSDVQNRGLSDDVLVLGHREAMGQIYGILDVCVLPSVLEGFGLAWAEAMACGIPVIVTRIAPMTEFIEHGKNGLLFDPDDGKDFLRCLKMLAESSEYRRELGDAGRVFVEDKLNAERQRKCYVKAFLG